MEQLREMLSKAARFANLELQLPELEVQQAELKETAADRKRERDWARLEARNLEEPGFFLRLLGKAEGKLEKARREAGEAAAAYEDVRRELEQLEHRLTVLREEYAALSGSREAYDRAREELLSSEDEPRKERLRELEKDAFRPAALEAVRQIRKSLLAARGWMQKDIQPGYYNPHSRRMEYLQLADGYAEKLQSFLVYFPEGSVTLGASMSQPSAYISSASMNLAQADLLNIAVDQSRRVEKQLNKL